MRVIVHSAGIQDRDGAALVFDKIRQRFNCKRCDWDTSIGCGWRYLYS